MPSKQLTDTAIRGLKPKASVYRVADAHGLALEVRPSGAKFWRYRYRFAGVANMLALGQYPAIPLQQARKERDRLRALLQAGSNPSQVAKAERAAAVVQHGTVSPAGWSDDLLVEHPDVGVYRLALEGVDVTVWDGAPPRWPAMKPAPTWIGVRPR